MKKSELIHYRLQAMLREHTFNGDTLKYLGVRKDSIGIPQHWYSIDGNEVPVAVSYTHLTLPTKA